MVLTWQYCELWTNH